MLEKWELFCHLIFFNLLVTIWCSMDVMVCKILNTVKSSKVCALHSLPVGPIGVSAWPILAPGPYV